MPSISAIPESTSSSLLAKTRAGDAEAWRRLSDLYGPLVYHWCRRAGFGPDDSADLVQDVFRAVVAAIADYRHDRPGDSFRGWLRTITRNKIRDHLRRTAGQAVAAGGTDAHAQLQSLSDDWPDDEATSLTESQSILRRALELLRLEFQEATWQAFWQTAVDGRSPADVATDLGISVLSVYQAKSRVLKRLREELEGLGESRDLGPRDGA
jgi:RNA polymerase sigma-70 factor (ECF subfamily)